ncbi:hypothetical protein FisN_28Lh032 [Fistulifera solaris]|jgi:putative MATE family efflux protein|uniref:Multidrug resistance protein, MATE family n=1 Tax=Fistulifera solaris TaxID=1519565 RepID=A0A1Z5KSB5_FISSO|nr:hypothetical protein FisN_28Lh032 [Fistulifera solaris]|eukprot:GAX29203.1 hypothetical protein FisN_28Lh032 [Fistulifera solaris]
MKPRRHLAKFLLLTVFFAATLKSKAFTSSRMVQFRTTTHTSPRSIPAPLYTVPRNASLGVNEKSLILSDEDTIYNSTTTLPSYSLDARSVFQFVTPTLALWMAPPIMSLIDTAVVGQCCGATQLAALAPACTLIDSSAYLCMFVATACTNLVASATEDESVRRTVETALVLAGVLGVFLCGMVWTAGTPLLWSIAGQASASVIPSALRYSLIRALAQPFVLWASVSRATLLARHDTASPLWSVILAFWLNLIGTVTLVKYAGWGIAGAAVATATADVAAALFLLQRVRRDLHVRFFSFSSTLLNEFLKYSLPIFATILGKSVVYNGVSLSVGRLGATALAAHQVLLRNFFFWTPVGDSVGMTSQVFLPRILQQPNTTKGARRFLFQTGVVAGLVAATLAGLLPSQGSAIFTNSAAVASTLRATAPILAFSVSLHAIALTCEGMLLAQRDLRFLSTSYLVTTLVTILWLTSPLRPASLAGAWWILALFQGGRAVQFASRTWWIARRKSLQKEAAQS